MSNDWTEVCKVGEIDEQDVLRFDHDGRAFAIYRLSNQRYYATDGLCTHEKYPLTKGFVMGTLIECPKHNGRFDVTTGKAKGAPACIDLKTYPVKVEGGAVFIRIS